MFLRDECNLMGVIVKQPLFTRAQTFEKAGIEAKEKVFRICFLKMNVI